MHRENREAKNNRSRPPYLICLNKFSYSFRLCTKRMQDILICVIEKLLLAASRLNMVYTSFHCCSILGVKERAQALFVNNKPNRLLPLSSLPKQQMPTPRLGVSKLPSSLEDFFF